MKESIFSVESVRRQAEQEDLQKKAGLKIEDKKKVPMNITLFPEHKYRLQEYARKKHLSASIIIQMWIEKYCV